MSYKAFKGLVWICDTTASLTTLNIKNIINTLTMPKYVDISNMHHTIMTKTTTRSCWYNTIKNWWSRRLFYNDNTYLIKVINKTIIIITTASIWLTK